MGAEHSHNQKTAEEYSEETLCRSGTCNIIGVDISTKCHEEYGRRVRSSGEDALGNLFASPFPRNVKISITHHRNSKYNVGQEIRLGTSESHNVREQKYPSLQYASTDFIQAMTGEGEFSNANCLLALRE